MRQVGGKRCERLIELLSEKEVCERRWEEVHRLIEFSSKGEVGEG